MEDVDWHGWVPEFAKAFDPELAEETFLRRHDPDQVLGFAVSRLRSMDHPQGK